jgi:hypothetical protein
VANGSQILWATGEPNFIFSMADRIQILSGPLAGCLYLMSHRRLTAQFQRKKNSKRKKSPMLKKYFKKLKKFRVARHLLVKTKVGATWNKS